MPTSSACPPREAFPLFGSTTGATGKTRGLPGAGRNSRTASPRSAEFLVYQFGGGIMFEGKGSPISKPAGFNLPIAALALAATLLGVQRAEADLLVSSRLGGNNGILRYDETTGGYLGRFADEYQADVQIEESNPALLYFGAWQTISDERASGGAYRRSNQRDASVQFEPASRNIRW